MSAPPIIVCPYCVGVVSYDGPVFSKPCDKCKAALKGLWR